MEHIHLIFFFTDVVCLVDGLDEIYRYKQQMVENIKNAEGVIYALLRKYIWSCVTLAYHEYR